MKTRLILLGAILLFTSMYSCGSKKNELRKKEGIEEKGKEKHTKKKHKPTLAEIFAESITYDDLDYHVHHLADSTMEGRETGKPGGTKAAKYIWDFFLDQHLMFPKESNGYFQEYSAAENDRPTIVLKTDVKSYIYGDDFISFFPHDSVNIQEDQFIFAGYGIEDAKYNDYAYRDVKDKIVLVVGGEPRDKHGNYFLSNDVDPYTGRILPSVWSKDPIKGYILRRNAAKKHGVKAMLYYDPYHMDYFWQNFKKHFEKKQLDVSVKKDSLYDFLINKDIFTDITGYDKPEKISYTKNTRKHSVPIDISYRNNNEVIEGINVMGFLLGNPKSDEYIIILSHYDGQGKNNGKIYPSANDNASGVAASFEIAEAFNFAKDSGFVPRRHLVFLNLSGKEQGALGARYYLAHPVVPLEKTVAVIELHKLGRIRGVKPDEDLLMPYPINIAFNGFKKDVFKKNLENMQSYNDYITLKFKPLVESSEYTRFMKKNIPVIYYYGSNYDDYHKLTDTPDRISYDVLEKRTRFVFQIIWQLAFQKKL